MKEKRQCYNLISIRYLQSLSSAQHDPQTHSPTSYAVETMANGIFRANDNHVEDKLQAKFWNHLFFTLLFCVLCIFEFLKQVTTSTLV